jgi:hypothetical protein
MKRMTGKFVALSLLVLLGGCSGAEQADAPAVATLQSAAALSSAAAKAGTERPIVPIDATEEDIKVIAQPWVACLAKRGGADYQDEDAWQWFRKGFDGTDPVMKACLPKMPETQQDVLKRTDMAAFKDNQREFYQCAKREGYKLTAPDPVTGEFGLTSIGPNGDANSAKWQKCEREAFAS